MKASLIELPRVLRPPVDAIAGEKRPGSLLGFRSGVSLDGTGERAGKASVSCDAMVGREVGSGYGESGIMRYSGIEGMYNADNNIQE